MRPHFLLGALAIMALGLCGSASAAFVVYDHFDGATLDSGLWTVNDWGGTGNVTLSDSNATLDGGSGWVTLESTATFDGGTPNKYEFGYTSSIQGSAQQGPYFGLHDGSIGIAVQGTLGGQFLLRLDGTTNVGSPFDLTEGESYVIEKTPSNTWLLYNSTTGTILRETGVGEGPGAGDTIWLFAHARPDGEFLTLDYVAIDENAFTPGDFNTDGAVDVSDLGILATNYGTTSGMTWGDGDANGDGAVDVSDLGILATNYGTGTAAAGAVPEPAGLALLLGAIPILCLCRRRYIPVRADHAFRAVLRRR